MYFKVSERTISKHINLLFMLHSCILQMIFVNLQLILLTLFYMCRHVNMFYVPGVAPVEFVKGQPIMVKAVKMTSTHTQLPYEYYSLQFCLPKNGTVIYKTENLGEVLRGDRIVNTPYEVKQSR